jgi:hypothetical protein
MKTIRTASGPTVVSVQGEIAERRTQVGSDYLGLAPIRGVERATGHTRTGEPARPLTPSPPPVPFVPKGRRRR